MDLADLSLLEASDLLHSGQISSRELTRACLERISALDPSLHAFLHVAGESALKAADRADRRLAAPSSERARQASLLLGIGTSHLDREEFKEALTVLDRILADYPESDAAPEAQYLRGVVSYKQTDDMNALKEMGAQLKEKYPASEWTKRASVYQAI